VRHTVAGVRSSLVVLGVLVCLAVPARAAGDGWQRPVDGPVLRVFSVGPDRFAAGQHRGVDLSAPPGAVVRAACGGRVSFAGRVPRGGRTVSVRCGRLVATYQHLGSVAVGRGQVVVAGSRIGWAGSARPLPHVHLGARDRASGMYVDPLALFADGPPGGPPPLPVGRRPLPLGPAPVARPARVPRPIVQPLPARPLPAAMPAPDPRGARLPWPVWVGLGLVCLGVPLGGVVRGRARRRARAAAPVAQVAS
jgi:murein DD-endopeptidase MepM/ murein hydrolase activator NlpD